MSIRTQGTQLYFFDPDSKKVLEVDCIESISLGSETVDSIDDTCLKTTDTRDSSPGLASAPANSFGLRTDFSEAAQLALNKLYESRDKTDWYVGLSDGTDDPSLSGDDDTDVTLPAGRTWIQFNGYLSEFPIDISQNAVVTSSISIQQSGPRSLHPKS